MLVFSELLLLPCFGGLCRNQKPQQQQQNRENVKCSISKGPGLTSAALPKKENILKWHLLTLQLYCLEGEIHPFVECQDRIISMLFIPLEKIYPHCTGLLKRVKFPPSRISKTRFPLQWKQGLFLRKNIFLLLFNNKQTKTPNQNKLETKKEREKNTD